jgi:hypothetical protein
MKKSGKFPKTLLKTWFIDNLGEYEIWLNYICEGGCEKSTSSWLDILSSVTLTHLVAINLLGFLEWTFAAQALRKVPTYVRSERRREEALVSVTFVRGDHKKYCKIVDWFSIPLVFAMRKHLGETSLLGGISYELSYACLKYPNLFGYTTRTLLMRMYGLSCMRSWPSRMDVLYSLSGEGATPPFLKALPNDP